MGTPPAAIVITNLTGGQNNTDPPLSLRPDQAVSLVNVHWKDTTFAAKRGGSTLVTDSGGTAFSVGIQTLIRHVPGADETLAEFWGVDGAATPIVKRMVAATTFANVTLDDAIASRPKDVVGASLNGKLFLAYDSSVDRLHVYDPGLSSPRVRRVGIAASAAPTVADTGGGGAYAAILAYWRVRWVQITGALVIRRSEPSPSVAFTPSGANIGVTVTQPTPPGEGENAWEIEVSLDNTTWAIVYGSVSTPALPIGTPTAAITATVAAIVAVGQISDPAGMYGLFPSVTCLVTDGNRLLGLGAWEATGATSGGKTSTVWFTPVLGSADKGDDERVPNMTNQKNRLPLNENDGGGGTALGVIFSVPFAFKYRQVIKLTPTGDVGAPYLLRKLRDDIGCISHKSLAVGEDHAGNPALYFLSHRGPYRIVMVDGGFVVQYLGRDNEVTWRSMNLAATGVVGHSVYHTDLHQWWVWIATGAANDPDVKMIFDVQRGFADEQGQIRGGWATHTGQAARCSVMFANTLAAAMSRDRKPYFGLSTGVVIWKGDSTSLDDAGTDFQAYAKPGPLTVEAGLLQKHGMGEPTLVAKALSGVTITLTTDRDFGKETRTHTALLTAAGSETRVVKKFEGGEIGEADVIHVQIGDGAAQEGAWTLDALVVPVTSQERR